MHDQWMSVHTHMLCCAQVLQPLSSLQHFPSSLPFAMAPKDTKRAKQTVSLEVLCQAAKKTLEEPNVTHYCSEDITVVVTTHKAFLLELAPITKRLNPASVSLAAKDVFKLSQREANLFGASLASAFSHCMLAGSKAVTGVKLHKDVVEVYNASLGGCKLEGAPVKVEAKQEPVKAGASSEKGAACEEGEGV